MHIADLDAGNLGASKDRWRWYGIAVGAALTQQMKRLVKLSSASLGTEQPTEGVFLRSSEYGFYLESSGNFLLSIAVAEISAQENDQYPAYPRTPVRHSIPGMFIPDEVTRYRCL